MGRSIGSIEQITRNAQGFEAIVHHRGRDRVVQFHKDTVKFSSSTPEALSLSEELRYRLIKRAVEKGIIKIS